MEGLRFGYNIPRHILKFFTYSEIIELFLISEQFSSLSEDQSFHQILLEDQFGLPKHKKGNFKQYYTTFQVILRKVKDMYQSINKLSQVNLHQIELDLYKSIRKEQGKYLQVDVDVRFLMIRSLSNLYEDSRFVFGGITYYQQQEFYMSFQDGEINLETPLYPEIMIQDNIVLADFNNKIGQGHGQRYVLIDFSQKLILAKWSQNYLRPVSLKPEYRYYDYFQTISNPKSDCTTNGIRIRTDARLVTNDPRFRVNQPFFSYQIRFSDNGASEKGAKLKMRKWVVRSFETTGLESVSTVEGEGVIGYYPHIYKGCEDFIYQSCCAVQGIRGIMQGHFQFQDVLTHQTFNVIVAPFDLQFGPNVVYSYNLETKEIERVV